MNSEHSANYLYLDAALKAHWEPFLLLEKELSDFVPRPRSDFLEYRQQELNRLKSDNLSVPLESLEKRSDELVDYVSSEQNQLHELFEQRIIVQYITVTMLSHALCEAIINAVLALGLAENETPELFEILDRCNLSDKWVTAPKSFLPSYTLDKSIALFESLQWLRKQRNAFTHYKIELEVNGQKIHKGVEIKRMTYKQEMRWLRRFFSLPYDLDTHFLSQVEKGFPTIFYGRGPISVADEHRIAIIPN